MHPLDLQDLSGIYRNWAAQTGDFSPQVGIVLGSGFRSVLEAVDIATRLDLSDLSGFPLPQVEGHSTSLVCGSLEGVRVVILGGRVHLYEGYSALEVCSSIILMAALGVESVLLTNAAGLIHRNWAPGEFMVLDDHLNLTGQNPLVGLRTSHASRRFVDMSQAYDARLGRILMQAVTASGLPVRRGIYAAVTGPSFETPAEVQALAALGADAVGMSTVLECVMGRFLGLKMAGLSCLTNWASGLSSGPVSHEDVLTTGSQVSHQSERIIRAFLRNYLAE